jgi:hypothetical protein
VWTFRYIICTFCFLGVEVSVHNFPENLAPLSCVVEVPRSNVGCDTTHPRCWYSSNQLYSTVQYSTVQCHFLELPFQFIISIIRCYTSTGWADNYKRQVPSREWNAVLLKIRLFCNVTLCRLVIIVTDVSQKRSVSIYRFELGCASEGTKLFRNVRIQRHSAAVIISNVAQ